MSNPNNEDKKKKRRKKALILLVPLLLSGTAAGGIAAALLYRNLNKDNYNPYLNYYGYNDKGDIKLEFVLPQEKVEQYKNKEVSSVFVDENGKEYIVSATVDANGKVSFDTSSLPKPGNYNLSKVVDKNTNEQILSKEELPAELKTSIKKPSVDGSFSTNPDTNSKVLNLNVNEGLANRELELTFTNEKGETFTQKVKVDKNGQISFDSKDLPSGSKWTLTKAVDADSKNQNPVINVNDIPEELKTIDKQDYSSSFSNTKNGNVELSSKVDASNVGKQVVGVFTDKDGKEHKVEGTVQPDGTVKFDTSSLPKPGEYNLNRIVEKDNENNVIKSNDQLSDVEKSSIKRPEVSISKENKDITGSTINISLHPSKSNKDVILTFTDANGETYKVPAKVGVDGKLVFDSSEFLDEGNKYTLQSITDNEGNKVADLSDLSPEDLIIDKINYAEVISNNSKGDKNINLDLGQANANKEAVAIFTDKDGNEVEVPAQVDANGKLVIDTSKLPNHNEYKLKEVRDNNENVILSNSELPEGAKSTIKKPEVTVNVIEDEKGSKDLSLNLPQDQVGKEVEATFTNSKGEEVKVKATVDANGNLVLDTSNNNLFPEGEKYTLNSIKDANGNKVVNLDNVDTIVVNKVGENSTLNNKNNYLDDYSYNKDGQLELNVALPKDKAAEYANKPVTAVFVDENGKKHEIQAAVDAEGNVKFNTNDLPKPGQYVLDQVVDPTTDPATTLLSKDQLSDEQKTPIKRPAVSGTVTTTENGNDKVLNLELNPALANRELELEFTDENGNKIKKNVKVTPEGKLVFDSSSLPEGQKWTLSSVKDADNLEGGQVLDTNDLPEELKVIDKVDYSKVLTPNDKGSVDLNVKLPKDQAGKEVTGVFKDKDGNFIQVQGTVQPNGTVKFDTSSLPEPGEYSLDRVLDPSNENAVLKSADDLSEAEKTTIKKPEATISKSGTNQADAKISIDLHPSRSGEQVTATFVDKNGNKVEVPATIGPEGKLEIDASKLPDGKTYTLESVKDNKNQPVVDLSKANKEDLVIDKANYNDGSVSRDENGNAKVNAQLPEGNANKEVKAVFTNEHGETFEVPATTDANGNVSFDTSSLPTPGNFSLDRVVDKESGEAILSNNQLSDSQKVNIKKPEVTAKVIEDAKGSRDLELSLPQDQVGKEVEATFTNSKGEEVKVKATVDANGNLVLDTSNNDLFPEGEKYTLKNLTDSQGNKVVDVTKLPEPITVAKTGNKLNGEVSTKPDGSKQLEFNVPEGANTNGAVARLTDVNGNVVEVPTRVDENGKLVVDTSSLDPKKVYTLDQIVNPTTSPETTLVSGDDLTEDVKKINDTKEEARKVTFTRWSISDLATTKASIEVSYEDINNLIDPNANYVLTLSKKDDTNSKVSVKAKVDKERNRFFFDFTTLESNKFYVFDSIKPEFTNESIDFLNKLTNEEFKTPSFDVAVWGNTTTSNVSTNSIDITFTIDESDSVKLQDNEEITAHYVKLEKDGTESETKTFTFNKQTLTHSLSNLDGNSIYVIKQLSIQKDGQKVNLFKNEKTKFTQEFKTNATPISLTFNGTDEIENVINYEQAKLKFTYTDVDGRLEIGNPFELTFKKVGGTNEIKVSGRVIENNKIAVSTNNDLESNTEYVLISLTTTAKNTNSAHAYTFTGITENSKFRTRQTVYDVAKVAFAEEYVATKLDGRQVKVTLDKQGRDADNKKAKIIFRSEGDALEIESNSLVISENTSELTFTLPTLISNRNYIFDRLVYEGETDQFTKRFINKDTVNFAFITEPGRTEIINWTFEDFKLTSNDLKVIFNNPDQSLDDKVVLELTITKTNDETFVQKFDSRSITAKESNFEALFEDIPMDLNQEYKVVSIKVKSPVTKSYRGVNGTSENIIFQTSEGNEQKFVNKFKVLSVTNSELSEKQTTVTVTFDETNNLLQGKSFRLKYVGNGNDEKLSSVATSVTDKTATFTLSDIDSNRQYTFVGVYYDESNKDDSSFVISEDKKIVADNSVSNVITVAPQETKVLSHEITEKSMEANTLRFAINNPDNVFENGQVFVLEYFKTEDANTTLTKEGTLSVDQSNIYVTFANIGMDVNKEYKVKRVLVKSKPSKAHVDVNNNNIIYDKDSANATEYVLQNRFNITSINSVVAQNNDNITVTIVVDSNNNLLENKKYKARFVDHNGVNPIFTEVATVAGDTLSLSIPSIARNREYTFDKLYFEEGTGDGSRISSNSKFVPNTSNIENKFEVTPGETTIQGTPSVETKAIDSNTIKFIVNNPDKSFNVGNLIVVEYYKVKLDESETEDVVVVDNLALASESNGNFSFTLNLPMDINREYKIKSIKVKEKSSVLFKNVNNDADNAIYKEGNANGVEYKYKNTFNLDSISSTIQTNTTSASINTTFSIDDAYKADKKFVLKYIDNVGNVKWSNLASDIANPGFTLSNLNSNRQYTFEAAYFVASTVEESGLETADKTIIAKSNTVSDTISIEPAATNVSEFTKLEKSLSGMSIQFAINNPDKLFDEHTEVTLEYNKVSAQESEANLTATANLTPVESDANKFTVKFSNLTLNLNEKYVVKKIRLSAKPSAAWKNINDKLDNVIYNSAENSERYEFENKFIVTSIADSSNSATDGSKNITVTFEGDQELTSNKSFRLKYKDQNDVVYWTSIAAMPATGTTTVDVQLTNLNKNRQYTFDSIYYDATGTNVDSFSQDSSTNSIPLKSTVLHTFEVEKGATALQSFTTSNQTLTSTDIKVVVNNPDNALSTADTLNIQYVKVSDSNQSYSLSANLVADGDNFKVEFTNVTIDLNEEYILDRVWLNAKPGLALKNISENNVIYQKENDNNYKFMNKFKLESLEIPLNDSNRNVATVNATLDFNNNLQTNKKYRAKFIVNEDSNRIIWSNIVDATSLNESSKNLTLNLSGLELNRSYKFVGLYWGEASSTEDNFPNTNDHLLKQTFSEEKKFENPHGDTKASELTVSDHKLNSVDLKFKLTNPDNGFTAGTTVVMEYIKKSTPDAIITSQPVALTLEGDVYYATFDDFAIDLNTEYTIKKLKVTAKPNVLLHNINNNDNNEINVTELQNLDIVNKLKLASISNSNQQDTSTINIKLDQNNGLLNNKYFAAKYTLSSGEVVWTNVQAAVASSNETDKADLTLTLSDLISNRTYTFVDLYWTDNQNATASDLTNLTDANKVVKEDSISNSFTIAFAATRILSKSLTASTINSGNWEFTINDPDKLMTVGSLIVVGYLKESDPEGTALTEKEAELVQDGANYKVTFENVPMDVNAKYLVKELRLKTKTKEENPNINGRDNNAIYNSVLDSEEQSFINEFKLASLSNNMTNSSAGVSEATITANFTATAETFGTNHKFAIQYKSANDENEIITSNSVSWDNSKTISLTLTGLNKNRNYVFHKLLYTTDNTAVTTTSAEFTKENSVSDSFIIAPGSTSAINPEISAKAQNITTVKFEITSDDNVLENNQEIKLTVGKVNDRTTQTDKEVLGNIVVTGSKYYVTFNVINLESNIEYKVYKIEFIDKPSKAYRNINSHQDHNEITLPQDEIKWTTSIEPTIESGSAVTLTPVTTQDQTLRGRDILEASYEVTGEWSNVVLPEELIDQNFENKGIVITYRGTATLKDDTTETHDVIAYGVDYNRNNKLITFKVKGMKAGYSYSLHSLVFKQNIHTSSTNKADRVLEINNVSHTSHLAKGYGWELFRFDPNRSYWPDRNADRDLKAIYLGFERGFESNDFIRLFRYIKYKTPRDSQDYITVNNGESTLGNKWLEVFKEEISQILTTKAPTNPTKKSITDIYTIQLGRKWEDGANNAHLGIMKPHTDPINKFYKPQLGGHANRYPITNGVITDRGLFVNNNSPLLAIDKIIEHVITFEEVPQDQINGEDTKQTLDKWTFISNRLRLEQKW
nr:DUF1410 domain-containing protein [Mycoplasmopsis canis]WQQ12625.1 DUF1410 domain-containing protein [Mycoplasmopsis canis]